MTAFKDLAEIVGVTRPSIGRIIKREEITATEQYDPKTRKIIKVISDKNAEFIIQKYKSKE